MDYSVLSTFMIFMCLSIVFTNAQYERCGNKNKKYRRSNGCYDETFLENEAAILASTFITDEVAAPLTGYIPNIQGTPLPDSGVHIGIGFDLGNITLLDLESTSLSSAIITKVQPYLGKTTYTAAELITYNNDPLVLTEQQLTRLNNKLLKKTIKSVRQRYNQKVVVMLDQTRSFRKLSKAKSTVLISLALEPGTPDNKLDQIWNLITPQLVNWPAIQTILGNFYDTPNNIYNSRRLRESDKLKFDDGSKCCPGMLQSGQCVFQGPDMKIFDAAREYCLGQDGDLAIMESMQKINSFETDPTSKIPSGDFPYWVGSMDCTDKNMFEWVDGSKVMGSTFDKFWADGGPTSERSIYDCVAFDPVTKVLQEHDCTDFRYFLCEISMIDSDNNFIDDMEAYEEALETEKASRKKSAMNVIYESGKCVAEEEGAECDISFTFAQKEARAVGASVTSVLGEGQVMIRQQKDWNNPEGATGQEGGTCSSEDFACSNGQCVPLSWECDEEDDCGDNSDEGNCGPCSDTEFECANGNCVPLSYQCDTEDDCYDDSDEEGCECTSEQLTCTSGRCYPLSYECDGDNDCGDNSDEVDCGCSDTQFECNNGNCVRGSYQCDTDNDCGDNSDEVNCGQCSNTEFECNNGNCVPGSYQCDTDNDCGDNSDEANCGQCSNTEFECNNGNCVPGSYQCDTDNDCGDNSDEVNCGARGVRDVKNTRSTNLRSLLMKNLSRKRRWTGINPHVNKTSSTRIRSKRNITKRSKEDRSALAKRSERKRTIMLIQNSGKEKRILEKRSAMEKRLLIKRSQQEKNTVDQSTRREERKMDKRREKERRSIVKRNVIAEQFRYWLWNSKIVPYTIRTDLFSSAEMQNITAGMKSLEDYTCIDYTPRTTEAAYIEFTRGNTQRPGCWSFIGRSTDNGPSDIHLDSGCTAIGTIQHELMHSLGFWHEHSRTDRDEYVTVVTDNIQSGYEMNFAKLSATFLDTLDVGYDYNSVLHYGMYIFAADPSQPTIVPNLVGADIGQRESVSDNDISEINKLYECPIPVDGGWSQWTVWTPCTKTCNSGLTQRSRVCNVPVPRDGGRDCEGLSTVVALCKTDACPGEGLMYRWYGCWNDPRIPSLMDNIEGEGNLTDDYKTRNNKIQTCALEAKYGGYNVFGLRSSACHLLDKSLESDLNDYIFLDPSEDCMNTGYGAVTALDVYMIGNVSVTGQYGVWSFYNNCSEPCSINGTTGFKNRTRQCNNPAPEYAWDLPCEGSDTQSTACNPQPCPVDGNWGLWSQWSDCSKTCGQGERYRTRECNNPAPINGKVCLGFINSTDVRTQNCSSPYCPTRIGCPDVQAPDRAVFQYADSYFPLDEPCIGGNSMPGITNVLTAYDGNGAADLRPGRSNMSILIDENQKYSGEFYGRDHCIHQPHNCSDGFSVSLWVKPIIPETRAEISPQMIFTSGVESDEEHTVNQGQGVAIFLRTDNVLKAVVKTNGTSYSTDLPQYLITTEKFHHIAVTWSQQNGLTLYYGGVAADWDRIGTSFDGSFLKTYFRYNIGRLCSCDGQQYYGHVDEFAVFNKALTAEEIKEVYMSVPMNCDDCDNNANCTQDMNCTVTNSSCFDTCTCNDHYTGNGLFCQINYGNSPNPTALGEPLYYFPMDSVSGTNVSLTYPMVLTNPVLSHDTMLVSMGIHNNALVFDGRNDWIDAGQNKNSCLSEPDLCENGVTLSFYLKYQGRGQRHNFILSTGALPWERLNSTGLSMWIWNVTANVCVQTLEILYCLDFVVDQGLWAHYTIVWDLVNKLSVYSNGMPMYQNMTETNQTSYYSMNATLAIGKPSQLAGFNGRFDLDNLVIYDRNFSAEQVRSLNMYGVQHSLMKK